MNSKLAWRILAFIELIAIAATILLDLFLPTIIIVGLMFISLLLRRERIRTVGFRRPLSWPRLAGLALIVAFLMQLFDVGVVMPIMNRLTGDSIDYSGFANIEGNLGQLVVILVVSWTIAAVGEELAYRGYLQKTLGILFGKSKYGVMFVVAISSILFGLAHTEQGLVGVTITTIDALIYSWLKIKYDSLWAPILAHGFYNSIGVIVFYFTGPIYGLW